MKMEYARVCMYVHMCDYRVATYVYENSYKADNINSYSWKLYVLGD